MEIRFFKVSETNELQQGINDIWGKNHILVREEKLLKYMFFENPSKNKFIDDNHYSFLGAWKNGRLIAILGIMPFNLNIQGRKEVGCSLANWAVLQENRNSGAGLALMQEVQKFQPSVILALGINENVALLYKMMGWKVLYETPRWIGILNKEKTIDKMLGGDHGLLRYWKEVKAVQTNSNYIVNEVNDLEKEKWDKFYWEYFAKQSAGFTRDYSFIKWRYLLHPYFKYKVLLCIDADGNYKGLAIIRIENVLNGESIGRIVEFISSDQDSAISLANSLINIDKDMLFFDFFCFSSISTWGLEAVGFKRTLKSLTDNLVVPLRFQPLDLEVTNLMASMYVTPKLLKEYNIIKDNLWYVTKGDADQDRPN
ncbi:hypothetical protein [Bacillus sp. V5-8f]|uniref:hypothetical protein n=1 Tax=Bacillus sp. V5-8f TaxID=2053044 RepID=UPI000C76E9A3|nr:hypothetical protein [Bacillus sp. V5-8f]PLT35491.1 hypothetical protein CUU64_02460 [Bacillus sp. V5-8f]